MKRTEIIPSFALHTFAYYEEDERCYILSTNTYCMCCDRFLDEVKYTIKLDSGTVLHKVPESQLSFFEEI